MEQIDVNKLIDLLIVIMTLVNYYIVKRNTGRIEGLHERVTEVEDKAQNTAQNANKGSV